MQEKNRKNAHLPSFLTLIIRFQSKLLDIALEKTYKLDRGYCCFCYDKYRNILVIRIIVIIRGQKINIQLQSFNFSSPLFVSNPWLFGNNGRV